MALHIARTASLVSSNQNLITVPTNDSDYIVDHGHGRPVTSREFFGFPYIEEPSFTAFGPQSGRFACEDPDITARKPCVSCGRSLEAGNGNAWYVLMQLHLFISKVQFPIDSEFHLCLILFIDFSDPRTLCIAHCGITATLLSMNVERNFNYKYIL